MILYHGSNIEIDQVDFDKSKPGKDFGLGFYLSADYQQAQLMGGETYQFFFGTEKSLKYLKKL